MRVLLAGGTGLVGSQVTERLAGRTAIDLTSIVRSAHRPGERAIDFEALAVDPASIIESGSFDVGISCLGTTIRKAGSQTAFRRVDRDYTVAVARAARARGARQFILVTSVGAGGRGFYLEVKGEVETRVQALGFERVDLIRPGLLLGTRRERRPGERVAQHIAPLLRPLLRGSLQRYAAIEARIVAAAIVRLIGAARPGVYVHDPRELHALAGDEGRG